MKQILACGFPQDFDMYWISIRSEDGFDRYKLINSCWIFNLLDFSSRLLSNSSVVHQTLKVIKKSPWEATHSSWVYLKISWITKISCKGYIYWFCVVLVSILWCMRETRIIRSMCLLGHRDSRHPELMI